VSSEGSSGWVESSKQFVDEVVVESKKVAWPKLNEVVAGSISVIVVVAIIGVALGVVDAVLAVLMRNLLP
jgi:preprotein translocase subunit SecE